MDVINQRSRTSEPGAALVKVLATALLLIPPGIPAIAWVLMGMVWGREVVPLLLLGFLLAHGLSSSAWPDRDAAVLPRGLRAGWRGLCRWPYLRPVVGSAAFLSFQVGGDLGGSQGAARVC